MRITVVSDCHLKIWETPRDRVARNRVAAFLKQVPDTTDLLILNGDIFDLWYAWDTVIIKAYFPIVRLLADIAEKGVRIVMIAGNHDFWLRGFLGETLGVEVRPDAFSETIDGRRLFIAHGDVYTFNDTRYRIYRRLIRSPFVMRLFEAIHPNFGLRLGMGFSRTSRKLTVPENIARKKEHGLLVSAEKLLGTYDIVVFGHSHRPVYKAIGRGFYLNAGDWVDHATYVRIVDGVPELCEFPVEMEDKS